MRRWMLAMMAALMAVVLVVPAAGADGHIPSIVDVLTADGDQFDNDWNDFDILTEAVIAAGLAGALDDGGLPFDVTVFAPNDAAFRKLAQDMTGVRPTSEAQTFDIVASVGIATVADVLLYHVVEGEVFYSTALTLDGADVPTLLGPTFQIGVMNNTRIMLIDQDANDRNAVVNRRAADIDVSNGVIHGIDRVMRPIDLP